MSRLLNAPSLSHWRGDVRGGLQAAAVALPMGLAFGVVSGLGPAAGIYGAIVTAVCAALFGGTATQISGPTGPIAIVMASVVFTFMDQPVGILAVVVLLIFVRSVRATVVVSTSIPISIIGTFIFLDLFGRNLNVVSLAGIAFAVGMLVDSAIVVIENIDRHRKMGKSGYDAAYDGTKEV